MSYREYRDWLENVSAMLNVTFDRTVSVPIQSGPNLANIYPWVPIMNTLKQPRAYVNTTGDK